MKRNLRKMNLQFFAEGDDGENKIKKSQLVGIIKEEVTSIVKDLDLAKDISEAVDAKIKSFEENITAQTDTRVSDMKNIMMNLNKPTEVKQEMEKGLAMARVVKLAHKGKNDPEQMLFYAKGPKNESSKGMYGDCPSFIKSIEKSIKDMSVSSNTDGGFLVQEQYADEIVELLRARVFLFQAGAGIMPMAKGNLNMPVQTAGALSYFRGEGKPAVPSDPKFDNIKAVSKIQESLVIMTNEILENNSYAADRRIRDDMLKEAATVMNYVALFGAGTEYTPLGLYNKTGVVKTDLSAALANTTLPIIKGEVMKTNVNMDSMAWVFNGALWAPVYNLTDGAGNFLYQSSMDQNKLLGDPFHLFNDIPIDATADAKTTMFYGDWSNFEVAEQNMFAVDVSKEASITYPGGTKTINLWQNGMSAIKMTSWYDFIIKHPEAFIIYENIHTK